MKTRLALLLSLVVIPSAPASDEAMIYLVRGDGRGDAALWKAASSGAIELVQPSFGAGYVAGLFNDVPVVSPDGKLLVVAKSGDLWIRDLATSAERRITEAARPDDGHYAEVRIEVRAWSPRGDQLLYEIVRPDRFPRAGCGEGPASIVREAPYGLFLYDLKSRASRPVPLPGEFAVWLSNQELAATTGGPRRFASPYIRMKLGSSEQRPLPFPTDRFCGQLAPAPDGSWLLASCYWDQKGQLMEMSLRDGHLRSITAEGDFAEFQWPTFSPTGRRIAWIQQVRPPWDRPLGKLIVDSKPVFASEDVAFSVGGYRWIDNETILCTSAKDLFVVDVSTGEVKGTAHTATGP